MTSITTDYVHVGENIAQGDNISRELSISPSYSSESSLCRRKIQRLILTTFCAASSAGFIVLRVKNYSSMASTTADLGIGFMSPAILKVQLTDRSWKVINGFCCRWGFEMFEFFTQVNLNRKELQEWFGSDPTLVSKITLTLIGIQAGHALFNEYLRFQHKLRSCCPSTSENQYLINPFEFKPRKRIKLLGLSRDNKGLAITQTTKLAIAIGLIVASVLSANKEHARFICENLGTYLATHAAGCTWTQLYINFWNKTTDDLSEIAAPRPAELLYAGYSREESFDIRTKSRASCCLKLLKLVDQTCKVVRQPLMGLIMYVAEASPAFSLISSGITGFTGGAADISIRNQFEKGLCYYQRPPLSPIREGRWYQKACREVRDHFSDPSNVIKDVLLAGLIAWCVYGITTLDDNAPKIGITLLLASIFAGYGITKVIDAKFRPGENSSFVNSLYYHFLQNPDYLLLCFAYLKSLSVKMGRHAYSSPENAFLADLGWVSLGLAAGNNRALQNSSQPIADRAVPIAKAIFGYIILDMFLDRLGN